MDAETFLQTIKDRLPFFSTFPGNSQGQTTIPTVAGDVDQKVGGAANSSWTSDFFSGAESVITAPYRVVHGAYDEVTGAVTRAGDLVSQAQAATVQAATGFYSWTKWVVIGLIAVAVIYVLISAQPFLTPLQGGLRGKK